MERWGFCGPVNDFGLPPASFPMNLAPSSIVNRDGDGMDRWGLCGPVNDFGLPLASFPKNSSPSSNVNRDGDSMDRWGFCGPVNDLCSPPVQPVAQVIRSLAPSSLGNQDGDSQDEYEFNDEVLKYISEMLMEEDVEEKAYAFQESSAALQEKEKSLYDLLGEKYPPSPKYEPNSRVHPIQEVLDENHGWNFDLGKQKVLNFTSMSNCQSSLSSGSSAGSVVDGFMDSPVSTLVLPETFGDSGSIIQFRKGFEEASKFIPNGGAPFLNLERYGLFLKVPKEEAKDALDTVANNGFSTDSSRGKKNPHPEDAYGECGRSHKQAAVFTESTVTPEMFEKLVLDCESQNKFREALMNQKSKDMQQNGSSNGKARGKKQGSKRNVVDLRTLLTLCAQAVAADDRRTANDYLKQIRQHASPTGDGMQRMAHYFADGLEARLAGSGTDTYTALLTRSTSAADVLKAYHLFLAACPFRKLYNFFCNRTIINLVEAKNVKRLHIVDFGVLYGFQWPCLIRRLSKEPGGPPKLRITGIDLPQPGFRPVQRVEETGRRLANFAKAFGVPFEFNAIAKKWDTIRLEDLKIDKDEVLVVNSMFRFRNLLDETVLVDCPRNKVLNLIRKMNPKVFIEGTVNGAYSAPFFITRFREAIFHFSTLFDMLETTIPREIEDRILIEREFFGREAINVIASEGYERIERPETYKQCQVRNMRAGFRQLPLDEEIMRISKERVDSNYHPDFVIDTDNRWMLHGWKGRIVYALSSWEPA